MAKDDVPTKTLSPTIGPTNGVAHGGVNIFGVNVGRDLIVVNVAGGSIALLSFMLPIIVGMTTYQSPGYIQAVLGSFLLGPVLFLAIRVGDRWIQTGALAGGIALAKESSVWLGVGATAVGSGAAAAAGVTVADMRAADDSLPSNDERYVSTFLRPDRWAREVAEWARPLGLRYWTRLQTVDGPCEGNGYEGSDAGEKIDEEGPETRPAICRNGSSKKGKRCVLRCPKGTSGRPETGCIKDRAPSADAVRLVEMGRQAMRAGTWQEAEVLFLQALEVDPKYGEALISLSDVYYELGLQKQALSYAEKAVDTQPDNAVFWVKYGDAYFSGLEYREALNCYENAKKLGSTSAAKRIMKIRSKIGEESLCPDGRPKTANGCKGGQEQESLDEAIRLTAQGRQALSALRFADAENLFAKALVYDETCAEALEGLSDVRFEQGSYFNAARFAERAIAIAPSNAGYHIKAGDAFFRIMLYDDALKHYNRAEDLGEARASQRIAKIRARQSQPANDELDYLGELKELAR